MRASRILMALSEAISAACVRVWPHIDGMAILLRWSLSASCGLVSGLGVAVRQHLRVVARVLLLGGAAAHHLEHWGAAGADEPHDECRGYQQKDDVEDGGVVPGDAGVGDFGRTLSGDKPEA